VEKEREKMKLFLSISVFLVCQVSFSLSGFSTVLVLHVIKARGSQAQLKAHEFDATYLKKCHFISNVSIQYF
jgi:hypothetical protein